MIKSKTDYLRGALIAGLILVALVWTLFPLYYLFLTSVKSSKILFQTPPTLIAQPTLETYRVMYVERGFYKFFANSFIVASGTVVVTLTIASFASFGFTQWRFKGKEIVFFGSLIGRMFAPVTTLVPIYLMLKYVRLLDNEIGLILVHSAFSLPLAIIILRDFFSQVPKDLTESAFIDGASSLQVLRKIVLPLSGNGLVAAGLLCFVESWNEFLFALVLTSLKAKTAPVVLATLADTEGQIQWGALSALGVGTVLPTVLVMVFLGRFLIRGLTLGAVKG